MRSSVSLLIAVTVGIGLLAHPVVVPLVVTFIPVIG